ncbi:MAG: desulfoferrodoxin [Sedimentisphaerales bacterium]|nr:desulfoferrodoxin [Sedimentisphaerales bacterium]
MAKRLEVYKCEVCGNIIEVLNAGDGELVCCDQPMKRLEEKTADAKTEKHVPVIEKTDKGYKVKVGSIPHPMTPEHYIQWIELLADGKSYLQFLQPGAAAEAVFCVEAAKVSAREHCNIHGLWKG